MICFAKDMHSSDPFRTWPLKIKRWELKQCTKRSGVVPLFPTGIIGFYKFSVPFGSTRLSAYIRASLSGPNDISLQSS